MLVSALLFGVSFLVATASLPSDEDRPTASFSYSFSLIHFDYFVERALDTLFVLDTSYLEVRLDSQAVYQHCRNGSVKKLLCSTGNKLIHKAVETSNGIFCVQSKSPIAISRQFDSTKMYFWVGFNGNIGFHGLDGKSYYRFLGKRPSSHGCIRMSREDAEWMFQHIPIGTPVFVHSGNAARCLAFIDSVPPGSTHIVADAGVRRGMERQLKAFYHGRATLEGTRPFYFDRSNVWWGGIPVGEIAQLPIHPRGPMFVSGARTTAPSDALSQPSRTQRAIPRS